MECKSKNCEKTKPELPSVIIEDDVATPQESAPQEVCENRPVSTDNEILVVDNEQEESTPRLAAKEDRPTGSRRARMRLRNLSPKNFGHYQLEYTHWLHMGGYKNLAKRRRQRNIPKNSDVELARRRSFKLGLARRQRLDVGLARGRPVAPRPTKLLRLDSSDRPAIKSTGPAASRAPVNLLRFPRNVVDVETVDAAVSSSDDRGVSDGVHAAIQMHFGAMARIKAGAKCRIMARRWTTDDRLEYLVQWEAGIVT